MSANAWLEARFAEIRPKALAALDRQFRDIDLAEEVFSAACIKALWAWVPPSIPERTEPNLDHRAGRKLLRR